jgi:hypothetical protein
VERSFEGQGVSTGDYEMLRAPDALLDLQLWIGRVLKKPLRKRDENGIPVYEKKLLEEAKERIQAGPLLPSEKRIGLYNQQVWYRFFNLLQKDFPSVVCLFGTKAFNRTIAEPYLLAHWPLHPSLSELGRSLPAYLTKLYLEEDRRLVVPVAALDEAHSRLADAPPLPILREEDLMKKICLQPTVALFAMEADLFSFRGQLLEIPLEEWLDRDFPSIEWGDLSPYVLWHKEGVFRYEKISWPAYRLLRSFEKGSTLEEAIVSLSDQEKADSGEKFFGWFQNWCKRAFFS